MPSVVLTGFPHLSAVSWRLREPDLGSAHARRFLLVPDTATALALREDLKTFFPGHKIYNCPALETDLLRHIGPSPASRTERVRFFSALFGPFEEPAFFIVPAEALTAGLPPAAFWTEGAFTLRQGEAVERDEVISKLVALGYLPAEIVEQAGQFAVRGSIVDVFPPTCEHPVRIEMFDDNIQSIHLFEESSQRRISPLSEIWFGPCREFLYPVETAELDIFRRKLRAVFDEEDWLREDRDAVLERVQQKAFFATLDYWAGYLPNRPLNGELWRELLTRYPLLVWDPEAVGVWGRSSGLEAERDLRSARVEGEWVPKPEAWLLPRTETEKLIEQALSTAAAHLSPRTTVGSTTRFRSHEKLTKALAERRAERAPDLLAPLIDQYKEWKLLDYRVLFASSTPSQLERLQFLLDHHGVRFPMRDWNEELFANPPPIAGALTSLTNGFIDEEKRLVFLLESEIFGVQRKRSTRSARTTASLARVFGSTLEGLDLKPGDPIVHKVHGIGKYLGLKVLLFHGVPSELVEIEYKDGAKLLLPVTKLNEIQKHTNPGEAQFDRLGGQTWDKKKSRVRKELRNLAGELLNLYSRRAFAHAPQVRPDKEVLAEFAASFPFEETADQAAAIEKTLDDMRNVAPMDRLVCGDVGYGKTEVAIRAAHAAVAAGYQVAVLVPTTLLAAQHETTFRKRLSPHGFRVEGLSRFKTAKESRTVLADAAEGKISVLIGTHRLLSNDVKFKNLALLIVDEEQRFGVAYKERLKRWKANVHVLTLTATPIPRTLHMALSGLREISIILTPPVDRLSVKTFVAKKKSGLIVEAVMNETKRGGQVFYLYNRIQSMPQEYARLKEILPDISMVFVHGQMGEEELEKKMLSFYEGKTQLLLTTSIIESGLDIPNANTLIVDRADSFGLAQLYQIRGRVGRSSQRAFAYFLIPENAPITEDAEERLSVLESYQDLGSGFHIASHDMELRGTGDLLGAEQSGHINSLGIDTYLELLQDAVAETRGDISKPPLDPEINLELDTTLPPGYVPETGLRLMFYKKLAAADSDAEIDEIEYELEDRFGPCPQSVKNLISVMRVKGQLRRLGIRSLTAGKAGYSLIFDPSTPVNPTKLVDNVKRYPTLFAVYPDGKLLLKHPPEAKPEGGIMRGIENALNLLEGWCE